MPIKKYKLTPQQTTEILRFVNHRLIEIIDDHLHGEWLITDEMTENELYDDINARKIAALELIKSSL